MFRQSPGIPMSSCTTIAKGSSIFVANAMSETNDSPRLDATRSMLAAIVESSDDAIISKTLEGIITSWNTGATRIFGYTEKEVIGRPINILIPSELQYEENRILECIRSGQRIDHYETVRITKTGKKVDVSLTISPVMDSSGKIMGCSKIARDIRNRK